MDPAAFRYIITEALDPVQAMSGKVIPCRCVPDDNNF